MQPHQLFTYPPPRFVIQLLNKRFRFVITCVVLLTTLIIFALATSAQTANQTQSPPAIEWLKFQVPAEQQTRFIEQDAAIWTPVLSSYPGFQSKEIWSNPSRPSELVIITHWASFEQWQAIPQEVLNRTTQQFHEAMEAEYFPEVIGFRLAWRNDSE
jgi:uncharacterized protein (TIGR03792 family)